MNEIKKNLTIGSVFGETFNLYFQNFVRLIIPSAIFSVILGILMHWGYSRMLNSVSVYNTTGSVEFLIAMIILLLLFPMFNCYIIKVVSNCYLKKNDDSSELIQYSLKKFFPLLGLTLLFSLFTSIGCILLVVPGLILMIGWSLNYVAIAIEETGPMASLKRSWQLTKGYKGKLFLIYLIWAIVIYAIFAVVLILGGNNIGSLFTGLTDVTGSYDYTRFSLWFSIIYAITCTLLYPLYSALITVIYYKILKDKEGFATEQLADDFMSEEKNINE
ncbi:MAG: glycerophosphoryl diester phosphodiesterase membrane domain-containing protein [Spirochaetales bacterium]|nr:glycerophosphoryl diester phosphodiesterase membrane domain-containing protein [Spirochaetales bacterium]